MEVVIRDSFENALAIFKRGCIPILKELKDRQGYLSPSEKKRRKSMRARLRELKHQKREGR
jgi:ribosomal protein S21